MGRPSFSCARRSAAGTAQSAPSRDRSLQEAGEGILICDDTPGAAPVCEKQQRGQSLAEFVVILPLLLLILSGLLDLGRLYFAYVAVTDVAGEGASFASAFLPASGGPCPAPADLACPYDPSNPDPAGDDRRHLDCTCHRAYAATSGLVAGDELDVSVTLPFSPTFGSQLTVTVHYTHALLTPLLNQIVGDGALPLRAFATERVRDASTE